jgi:hypothetical protein
VPDAIARVDTGDGAGVCAPGATGGADDGVGAAGGVTTVGTLAGGGGAVGGLAAGTVAAGGGVVAPGTVTVTGETAGAVVAFLALGTAAAKLGRDPAAKRASNATVSSRPATIGRRAAPGNACLAATTAWSAGFPSQILDLMNNPFHRASMRRRRRAPTRTLV